VLFTSIGSQVVPFLIHTTLDLNQSRPITITAKPLYLCNITSPDT
jgi:hypothetical protein